MKTYDIKYVKQTHLENQHYIIVIVPKKEYADNQSLKPRIVNRLFNSEPEVIEYLNSNAIHRRPCVEALVYSSTDASLYDLGDYEHPHINK